MVDGFVAAVVLAGVAVTGLALQATPQLDLAAILVFCAAAAVAEVMGVSITEDSPLSVSLSLAVILGAVVVVGPFGAALAGICAASARVLRHPRPATRKTLFNIGLFALEGGAAGLAYHAAGGQLGREANTPTDVLACAAALAAYFVVAWPILVGIIRMTTGRPFRDIYEDFRWMPVQILVSAAVGFTLGAAYLLFGWGGAAVYVAPLLAVREAMRQYTSRVGRQMAELRRAHAEADKANQALLDANAELDSTNEGLLKTLASVIDARDIYLYGHSVQASNYAGKVARMMGLDEHQVRVTELGALLHDLGKIGVSEAILNKPARLTEEEYEEVKHHCDIGYQLLSNLPHFEEVAEVVWSHHEDYDGTGYPRGIHGEDIPIGARIVSVVEATEAMVSDRPYRKGMSPDEVLQELADGAGSQWDPIVVETFSGILSADRKHLVMRNSALDVALSRTPVSELVQVDGPSPLGEVNRTFHGASEPIFVLDESLRLVAANPAAEAATGWKEPDLQGRAWIELCASPDQRLGTPQVFFSRPRSIGLRRADGTHAIVQLTGSRLHTNSATYWLVLAQAASTLPADTGDGIDPLTGVHDRERFGELAVEAMAQDEKLTLVLIDVDGLAAIRQTFGDETSDAGLIALSRVLDSQLRTNDVAARVGDDRFAVLMHHATLQDAGRVVQRVEDRLPDATQKLDCVIELSSGAAQWDGAETVAELIERAEVWLEAEKRSRKHAEHPGLPVQVSLA
jgi:diguanylate cyclase (GGDEF)-like protein/putative nucleotidyltransferase with HDIG domain/PAS domain S-box-containing protein